MNTLIVYASTHGCTKKCAESLAPYLAGHSITTSELTSVNLNITDYDAVIIGSPIRLGRINKRIRAFFRKQHDQLLQKKLGLFICCMNPQEQAESYLTSQFPETLRQHATAAGAFGGELHFDKMTVLERTLLKQATGLETNLSMIDNDAIARFVADFSKKSVLDKSLEPEKNN